MELKGMAREREGAGERGEMMRKEGRNLDPGLGGLAS
jgi:hypothetical protein